MHKHPANQVLHDGTAPASERIGVAVAGAMATGAFIAAQALFIAAWIVLRKAGVPIDNAGLTILNLLLSLQAAFAAPLILLSQKRQTEHDRLRAEADHEMLSRLEALAAAQAEHAEETVAVLDTLLKGTFGA
jgi:uncharacterized membrane protein